MTAKLFYPSQDVRRLNGLALAMLTPHQAAVLAFSRRPAPIGRAAHTVAVVDGFVLVGPKKITRISTMDNGSLSSLGSISHSFEE